MVIALHAPDVLRIQHAPTLTRDELNIYGRCVTGTIVCMGIYSSVRGEARVEPTNAYTINVQLLRNWHRKGGSSLAQDRASFVVQFDQEFKSNPRVYCRDRIPINFPCMASISIAMWHTQFDFYV